MTQISPSATNPKLTEQGFKTTFRVVANDNQQGGVLANYAHDALKAKTMAIVDDRTAYGQGLADVVEKVAKEKGIKVVAREFATDKTTDFNAILTKIRATKPDVIMLHACTRVSGAVLWANLHLLFWLSLFPFVTGWMGENHFAPLPSAFYGLALLMAACAYWILQQVIIAVQGTQSILKAAVGADWKGKLSPVLYLVGIASTIFVPWIAQATYVAVALIWLIPDRRIERVLQRVERE